MSRYRGAHEAEIESLFEHATLAPGSFGDRMLVVVAFTNRCGSNLAANLMTKAGLTTPAREMLNADSVRRSGVESGRESAQAYVDWLTRIDKDDAPFAIKAAHDQMAMLLRWGARSAFGDMRVVHVVRGDLLGQAVSFSIAEQTKRWMSTQAGLNVAPAFDRFDILSRMDGIGAANTRILEICQIADIPLLRVSYEDIMAEPLRELGQIARFLGRPAPSAVPEPDLQKQADSVNEDFARRYRKWALEAAGLAPRKREKARNDPDQQAPDRLP